MSLEIQQHIEKAMKDSEAWLTGHFRLTSGKHSGNYMQCAMLLRIPKNAAFAGQELARLVAPLKPHFILSPTMGGLIIGHEVARALDVPFLFCERENGQMKLRRFPAPVGKRFVVIEDVVTTGGSLLETARHVESLGCTWVGKGCIVDRSAGGHCLGDGLLSLMTASFPVYEAEDCPLCKELGTEPIKPGSRQ